MKSQNEANAADDNGKLKRQHPIAYCIYMVSRIKQSRI